MARIQQQAAQRQARQQADERAEQHSYRLEMTRTIGRFTIGGGTLVLAAVMARQGYPKLAEALLSNRDQGGRSGADEDYSYPEDGPR